VIKIRITFDPRLAQTNAFCRAIAALGAFRCRAVKLDQHRIVNITAERAFNGRQIGPVAVADKLNAVGEARG
jgi:hypothetical protein